MAKEPLAPKPGSVPVPPSQDIAHRPDRIEHHSSSSAPNKPVAPSPPSPPPSGLTLERYQKGDWQVSIEKK